VPDIQRRRAFSALSAEVGLHPAAVLAAPRAKLRRSPGWEGPSRSASARPGSATLLSSCSPLGWRAASSRTPPVAPGAARPGPIPHDRRARGGQDSRVHQQARLLPLDSNALRVLLRLGLTPEAKGYRATYRRAQETLAAALPNDHNWLIAAYSLLRRHGQELVGAPPLPCGQCPFRAPMPFVPPIQDVAPNKRLKLAARVD